jgi:hypothetical protein
MGYIACVLTDVFLMYSLIAFLHELHHLYISHVVLDDGLHGPKHMVNRIIKHIVTYRLFLGNG